jgi:catechol 2,3-dioxygenase-like lactoylglutathione lyase family enzyme
MTETAPVSPLVRTAIIVADLERSMTFYREVIGIPEVYHQGHLTDPASAQLLGMPADSQTRFAIVKGAGPALGMVGLFEILNHSPPSLTRASGGMSLGETCLVFYHQDLSALTAKLKAGGHQIVCPPVKLQVSDKLQSTEMTFRDPDGVMINCIERTPDTAWQEQGFQHG